jgi:hypothetical protein
MQTQSFTSVISPLNLHNVTSESSTPFDELYIRTERDCDALEKVMRRCKNPVISKKSRTSSVSNSGNKLQLSSETVEALRASMAEIMEVQFTQVYDEETLCSFFRQVAECMRERLEGHEDCRHESKADVNSLKVHLLKKEQELARAEKQLEKAIKACDGEAKKLAHFKAALERRERRLESDCAAFKDLQTKYEEYKRRFRCKETELTKQAEGLRQQEDALSKEKAAFTDKTSLAQSSLKAELEQLYQTKSELMSQTEGMKKEVIQLREAKLKLTQEHSELQSKLHKTTDEVKRLTLKAQSTDRQVRQHNQDQTSDLIAMQRRLRDKEKALMSKEAQLSLQSNELADLSHDLQLLKSSLEAEHSSKPAESPLSYEADRALKAAGLQIAFLEGSVADLKTVLAQNEQAWSLHMLSCQRKDKALERKEAELKKQQACLEYAQRQFEAERKANEEAASLKCTVEQLQSQLDLRSEQIKRLQIKDTISEVQLNQRQMELAAKTQELEHRGKELHTRAQLLERREGQLEHCLNKEQKSHQLRASPATSRAAFEQSVTKLKPN